MSFNVGAIVSKLELNKKEWDASVKSVKTDQASMAQLASKHSKAIKKMGKSMLIAGGVIVGSLGLMVKSAVGFNKEMANVATLIPGQSKRINELKKNVQDLAMEYGKSTTDISNGLYQVVSAFGDTSDTAKVLEINVMAAAAGMATTADAIALTSAVTKAYGDTSAEAVQNVSDLAFQAVKLGQTTFPELASSIGRVTPLAEALNISQEELFATFATLTGVTGKASMVSTQFAGILGSMVKPTEGMGIAMSKLGKEIGLGADASAKAIIDELGFKGALEGLQNQTDGTMIGLGKLFESKEALVALLPLLSSQTEVYDKKLAAMKDSVGILDEAFLEVSEGINSAGFNMEKLKQTVTVLGQRLGDKLAPTIGKIALTIAKVVRAVSDWTEKHPVLTSVILKVVGALGALMVILGPILMILPGIIAAVGAMSASFIAIAGPIAIAVAALVAVVAVITSVIKAGKKMRAEISKLGDTEEEMAKNLDKVAEAAGLTAKEFEELSAKYNHNEKRLARRIIKGKEGIKLQEAFVKVTGKSVEVLEEETEAIDDVSKALTENLIPASTAVADLVKELADEIKKATLDETTYRIEKAQEVYEERKALLEKEGASNEAFVLAEKARDVELSKIKEERTTKAQEFWKKLVNVEKEARDKLAEQEAELTSEVNQQVMDRFQFALWSEKEKFKKQKKSIKDTVKNEKSKGKQLFLLEKKYSNTVKKLRDEMAKEELKRLDELKAARKAAFQEMVATVNDILGQVGSLFQGLFNLKMNLLDKEEKATTEAINKTYDTQIDANRDTVNAEKEKSEEIYKSINDDYEAKKQFIIDNVADEESRNAQLAALELQHNATLEQARNERELAEQATADALLAVEDAKNEAIRLASEELEKKRTAARQKAAKQEKAVAILSAIVNTAAGVVKALASSFPPFNIILAAITAAAGAVQIAVIKSTPLPLAKGGIVTEKTEALIGEAGPEAVIPLDNVGGAEGLRQFMSKGSGKGKEVNINIRIENSPTFNTFDPMTMKGVWREFIEPEMIASLRNKGRGLTAMKEAMGLPA